MKHRYNTIEANKARDSMDSTIVLVGIRSTFLKSAEGGRNDHRFECAESLIRRSGFVPAAIGFALSSLDSLRYLELMPDLAHCYSVRDGSVRDAVAVGVAHPEAGMPFRDGDDGPMVPTAPLHPARVGVARQLLNARDRQSQSNLESEARAKLNRSAVDAERRRMRSLSTLNSTAARRNARSAHTAIQSVYGTPTGRRQAVGEESA